MDLNRHSQLELTAVDEQSQQQQQFCTSLSADVATSSEALALAQSADWSQLAHSGPIQFVRIVGANGEELQMLAADYHTLQSQQVTLLAHDSDAAPADTMQFSQLTTCVPSILPDLEHHHHHHHHRQHQDQDQTAEQPEDQQQLTHGLDHVPEAISCAADICTPVMVDAEHHHHQHHQLLSMTVADHQHHHQQQQQDLSDQPLNDVSESIRPSSALVPSASQPPPATLSLSPVTVPFLSDENQHDPEVQYFADIYRRLVVGGDTGRGDDERRDGGRCVNWAVLRRRLKHYSICDGELYYGNKRPRKVLLDRCRQQEVLQSAHIAESGIHNGIRRMSAEIEYHWRGVYSDMVRTVRECTACSETQSLYSSVPCTADVSPEQDATRPASDAAPSSSKTRDRVSLPDCRPDERRASSGEVSPSWSFDPATSSQPRCRQPRSRAELQLHRATRVWKKVEARVLGPFPPTTSGCEYLATVVDPECRWLHVRACPATDRFSTLIQLLYTSFCQLGVAQCTLIDVSEQQFIAMHSRFKEKLARMQEIICNAVETVKENCFVFSLQGSASSNCSWAADMLERYVRDNGSRWDLELDSFLLAHHITASAELGHSPFVVMFGRNCDGSISEHDRESCAILEEEKALDDPVKPRRRLGSSMMKCRHCGETYTSKISFRIHQRRHTVQARRRGEEAGQESSGCTTAAAAAGGSSRAAVGRKLLRRAIRDSQLKRGNVAAVAKDRSNAHLCQPRPGWSQERLSYDDSNNNDKSETTPTEPPPSSSISNCVSSESMNPQSSVTLSTVSRVRSLLASARCDAEDGGRRRGKYTRYGDAMRHEIAAFAVRHGCRRACQHFSRVLGGRAVATSSVRNFVRSHALLTPQRRLEIGRHALEHGAQQTAAVYSQQLQLTLRVGVVRRYMREYRTHQQQQQQQQQLSDRQSDSDLSQSQRQQPSNVLAPGVIVSKPAVELSSTSLPSSNHLTPGVIVSTPATLSSTSLHPSVGAVAPLSPSSSPSCFPATAGDFVEGAPILDVAVNSANSTGHDHALYTVYADPGVGAAAADANGAVSAATVSELVPAPLPSADAELYQTSVSPSGGEFVYQRDASLSQQLVFVEAPMSLLSDKQQQQQLQQQHFVVVSQASAQSGEDVAVMIDHAASAAASDCFSRAHHAVDMAASDQSLQYSGAGDRLEDKTLATTHQFQEITSSVDESMECSIDQQQRVTVVVHASQVTAPLQPVSSASSASSAHGPLQPISVVSSASLTVGNLHPVSSATSAPPTIGTLLSANSELQSCDSAGDGEVDDGDGEDDEEYVSRKRARKRNTRGVKRKRGGGRGCQRGYYSTYSPELRAEVGRYAHEHGTHQARCHFGQRLGCMLPESTVRGLRDKYAAKLRLTATATAAAAGGGDDVTAAEGAAPPPPPLITSLGFGQRGRPIRLGKYERLVAECVRRLAAESSEPVSDFVCIASARQVLLQYEPELLEERGGPIRLNSSWARSFIKRMGFNNSVYRRSQSQ